jgi:uncharacterized membrane protein YbhN (UPF0104 family)
MSTRQGATANSANRQADQRRRRINILKVIITVGGLLFVIGRFDLRAIGVALSAVTQADGLIWLVCALALIAASLVVRAYRWFIIIHGVGVIVRFGRLVELYIVGNFFNAVLPSGFGGDVVRVAELTQEMPAGVATGTVIIDRLTGLLALFAMTLMILPFRPAGFPPGLFWVIILVCLVGLIAGFLLLHPSTAALLLRWMPAAFPHAGRTFLTQLLEVIGGCGGRRILLALAISFVFNLMQVAWWAAAARALGLAVPFSYLLLVIPLLAIALLVPSIGGLGVRETLAPALFAAVPLSPEQAIALSLLVFALERAASLLGGPVYLYTTWRDGKRSNIEKRYTSNP